MLTTMLRVDEPGVVGVTGTDAGLNVPVTLFGNPLTPRVTFPLNPPMDVRVIE